MTTFDTFSFGCRVNQAEMDALAVELERRGAARDTKQPDVFIINTCSVTHKADREARQMINQIHCHKPETKIVITGCAATNWIKIGIRVPHVALIVDNAQKSYLSDLIYQRIVQKTEAQNSIETILQPHNALTRSGRFMLKIQDGCQRFCSFCIVPYLRGLPVSIPTDQLIQTVQKYSQQGMSEIIYAAINTEAYGYNTDETFISLVERTLTETGIRRLSFGSIHPWSINDDFFEFYKRHASSSRLVHFFHIPLQSGCDKILSLMKRGYTRSEFAEKLKSIHKINPLAFLATDIIVGYLDESDADFEDTYDFLKASPLARFHVFRFSPRNHTAAYYMKKRLSMPSVQTAQHRSKMLRDLSAEKFRQFQEVHVGQTGEALVLEKQADGVVHALFQNQMPLMIAAPGLLPGSIVRIKILECKKNSLHAVLV